MSERDLAQVAARRLREAHDGSRAGAGFTKARIVRTLHERRRRRRAAWVVVGPLFAVFVGSTAWAQVTGHWPVWIQQAVLLFTAEQVSLPVETGAVDERRPRSKQGQATGTVPKEGDERADQREETVPLEETLPLEETAAVEATSTPGEPVVVTPAARRSGRSKELDEIERSRGKQRARRTESLPSISVDEHAEPRQSTDAVSSSAPVSSSAVESSDAMQSPPILEADPEFRAFRAGHDQHYRANDAAAAIAAYRRYLERYPRGRFVPEARYNIALNSLRLGRNDDAKSVLKAFADGRYGAYRQAEAKALLDAMD